MRVDSADGKSFVIVTKPLSAALQDVVLMLKGRSLQLSWNSQDGAKKCTHQWGLPFAIPAENISASFDSETRLTIQLLKDISTDESEPGTQKIHEFQLKADTAAPENRLKPKLQQSKTAYTFVLMPCNCDATVAVKVKDGSVLLLESIYKVCADALLVSDTGLALTIVVPCRAFSLNRRFRPTTLARSPPRPSRKTTRSRSRSSSRVICCRSPSRPTRARSA